MLVLVDSGGYPFVSSSVPIGFRIAQIPVVNHFLEYVTPRSLVAVSVRNVYGGGLSLRGFLVIRCAYSKKCLARFAPSPDFPF